MSEIIIWSLIVGSLGMEVTMIGKWLTDRQWIETQQWEEEELLTHYDSNEITTREGLQANGQPKLVGRDAHLMGWEFKIVRASRDVFRNPATFHKLCQEEGQVGWILLEKLDDRRVRFKRPIALREIQKSEIPPFDPYRSHYGPATNWLVWFGAFAFLVAVILPAFLTYALVSNTFTHSQQRLPMVPERTLPSPKGPEGQL